MSGSSLARPSSSSLWFSFVEAWADAFRSSPDLTGVVSVYEDLRRKGLEFPMTELDGYSPVQAPKQVPTWLVAVSLLFVARLLLSILFFFWLSFCQTVAGNGPAVTTLPAALLSSKPPLFPPQASELKLALDGTSAFTPSQVMGLAAFHILIFNICTVLLLITDFGWKAISQLTSKSP